MQTSMRLAQVHDFLESDPSNNDDARGKMELEAAKKAGLLNQDEEMKWDEKNAFDV